MRPPTARAMVTSSTASFSVASLLLRSSSWNVTASWKGSLKQRFTTVVLESIKFQLWSFTNRRHSYSVKVHEKKLKSPLSWNLCTLKDLRIMPGHRGKDTSRSSRPCYFVRSAKQNYMFYVSSSTWVKTHQKTSKWARKISSFWEMRRTHPIDRPPVHQFICFLVSQNLTST